MPGDPRAGGASPRPGVRDLQVTRDYPELLQRVPAIVYIAEPGAAGRWHYVSPQIKAILGFTAEEWLADPGLWAQRLHREDRDWVLASEAERAAGGGQPSAIEYRMRRRDGRVVWIRDDATLARLDNGTLQWHGVLSDITERKQVEAMRESAAANEERILELAVGLERERERAEGLEHAHARLDLEGEAKLALGRIAELEVATKLAEGAQTSIRFTKYALNNWLRMMGPSFDASTALEMLGFMGPEVKEGLASHLEKRKPKFDPYSPL